MRWGGLLSFIILLLVNLLVVGLYVLWCLIRYREKRKDWNSSLWYRVVVMLLCPVIAPLLFILGHLLRIIAYRNPVDLEDVVFSKDRVKTYVFADEEQERNIVPLEDAIAVSDTDSLRGLMMSVVKGDVKDSLATIAMALNSEDSETSHYAASVLQEALDRFRSNVQKGYQSLKEDPKGRVADGQLLLDYMNPVMQQRVFTDLEQKSLVVIMDDVGELVYGQIRRKMKTEHLEGLSMRLLEVEDFENCQKWCERAEYLYPQELSTYTCQLKLFFSTGKRNQFFRVLEDLRESDIIVDNETLELIRVFL